MRYYKFRWISYKAFAEAEEEEPAKLQETLQEDNSPGCLECTLSFRDLYFGEMAKGVIVYRK